jgi:hypothetical protein
MFGIIALSVAQLALLPTIIIWAVTFVVGPGFSLGSGAIVSPLGTQLQTVPALPILGIIPTDPPAMGIVIVVIPVIIAFVAGLLIRSRVVSDRESLWSDIATTGFFAQPITRIFCTAILAGLIVAGAGAFLAELVSGQMGPGRFSVLGPEAGSVALWWGLEAGVGVFIGLLAGSLARSRVGQGR